MASNLAARRAGAVLFVKSLRASVCSLACCAHGESHPSPLTHGLCWWVMCDLLWAVWSNGPYSIGEKVRRSSWAPSWAAVIRSATAPTHACGLRARPLRASPKAFHFLALKQAASYSCARSNAHDPHGVLHRSPLVTSARQPRFGLSPWCLVTCLTNRRDGWPVRSCCRFHTSRCSVLQQAEEDTLCPRFPYPGRSS